jgi:hypothetical protein
MGAPFINHLIRGVPTTAVTTTTATTIPAIGRGQTYQGAIAATAYKRNSIATRIGPGVGITTFLLSLGVEKTDGSPTGRISTGRISQLDQSDTAHGPAIHAMSSDRNRRPADTIVSWG